MLRVLAIVALVALTVYALVDCIQTPDDEVKGIPKVFWLAIILLAQLVGPLAWLVAGTEQHRFGPPGPRRPNLPKGPRGPDDDPDFLRNL